LLPAHSQAFWITGPGQGVLRKEVLPAGPPDPGSVLVRALYSGISRGTESLVFTGKVPPSQYTSMRAPFQKGDFPWPVQYGYSMVGCIVAGPPERLGQTVFCLHPHEDWFWIPGEAALALPAGVPPTRAILAANMETALNASWDARVSPGDRILVIGAGVVGLLAAWLLRQVPGTEVCIIDSDPGRRVVAETLGLPFVDAETTLADDPSFAGDFDLLLHASGNPAGLQTALRMAGTEATILELSWFGDREVCLPLGEAFHSRRLTLRSSQVGRIPPHQQPRWTYRRRLELALRLLRDPALDGLVTEESPLEMLPEVMQRLADSAVRSLCHRIRYP
jgi:threonine dehydrogenase-like Zn-dependent dehydrogenase